MVLGGNVFDDSMACLSPGGRIVTYGVASGQIPMVAVPQLFYANHSLIGYHLIRASHAVPERVRAATADILSMLDSGQIDPQTAGTYNLADVAHAHRAMEQRQTTGRPLLVP